MRGVGFLASYILPLAHTWELHDPNLQNWSVKSVRSGLWAIGTLSTSGRSRLTKRGDAGFIIHRLADHIRCLQLLALQPISADTLPIASKSPVPQ